MNLSRAYTLAYNDDLSVGRVQTPTLAMLVERELAIRAFVPEDYLEVVATFRPAGTPKSDSYKGTWFRREPVKRNAPEIDAPAAVDGEEAARSSTAPAPAQAAIESIEVRNAAHGSAAALRPHRTAAPRQPPLRFQRAEDSRPRASPLRKAQAHQLSAHRQPPPFAGRRRHPARVSCEPSKRPIASTSRPAPASVRSAAASSTMPKSPTTTPSSPPPPAGRRALSPDERKIYDLDLPPPPQRLARRSHLGRHHRDHRHHQRLIVDRYHTSGTAIQQVGWKVLDIAADRKPQAADGYARRFRPISPTDQPQDVLDVESLRKDNARRPSGSPKARCSPPWKPPARRSTKRSSPTP